MDENDDSMMYSGNDEVEAEYQELLMQARQQDFTELEISPILRLMGEDEFGRSVFTLIPCFIKNNDEQLQKAFLYCIHKMDSHVNSSYILIYCHSRVSFLDLGSINFLKKLYQSLPRKYKKNLKQLYILHADATLKLVIQALQKFTSSKFLQKIAYVRRLKEINLLKLPQQEFYKQLPYTVHRLEGEIVQESSRVPPPNLFGRSLVAFQQAYFMTPFLDLGTTALARPIAEAILYLSQTHVLKVPNLFIAYPTAHEIYPLIEDMNLALPHIEFEPPVAVATALRVYSECLPEPVMGMDCLKSMASLPEVRRYFAEGEGESGLILSEMRAALRLFLEKRLSLLVVSHKELATQLLGLIGRHARFIARDRLGPSVSVASVDEEVGRLLDPISLVWSAAFFKPPGFKLEGDLNLGLTELGQYGFMELVLMSLGGGNPVPVGGGGIDRMVEKERVVAGLNLGDEDELDGDVLADVRNTIRMNAMNDDVVVEDEELRRLEAELEELRNLK